MKYVLMFVETEQFARELEAMTESERQAAFERVGRWFADHAAHITHHAHLRPAETATTMRLEGAGPIVTDGPFVEGKEYIAGIDVIECANLDEAIEIASKHPMAAYGLVEIRPFWPFE